MSFILRGKFALYAAPETGANRKEMSMRWGAALLLVLATGAVADEGEIYTWKDKDGRINYADNPPTGNTPARTLSGRNAEKEPPAPAATETAAEAPKAQPSAAEQELEFRKRRGEAADNQAKAEKAKAESDERRRNCERARNQLAALESGQRVVRSNEKGDREYLDDAQRAQEIETTRKAAESWCK
jgi:hypothetical protein